MKSEIRNSKFEVRNTNPKNNTMTKQELEEALEAANVKIAELTNGLDLRDKHIIDIEVDMKRLETELVNAKAATAAAPEALTADELDIRARQRAGLTRAQAEAAHAAQAEHDARLAAAAKAA